MAGKSCRWQTMSPALSSTLAPMASRLEVLPLPESSRRSQWFWLPPSLRKSRAGPLLTVENDVEVAVAVDVGVSRSAADDRLEEVRAGVLGGDELERGPCPGWPEFQKSWAGWAYVSLAWTLAISGSRWPLAESKSSRPSRS